MPSTKEYRSPEIRVTLKAMGGEVIGRIAHVNWSGANDAGVAEQLLWIRVTGVPFNSVPEAMHAMETDTLLPIAASSVESITPFEGARS